MSRTLESDMPWTGRRLRIVGVQSREVACVRVTQQCSCRLAALVTNGCIEETGAFLGSGFNGEHAVTLQGTILKTGKGSVLLEIVHAESRLETNLPMEPFLFGLGATMGQSNKRLEVSAGCGDGFLIESGSKVVCKQPELVHLEHEGRKFSLLADLKPQAPSGSKFAGVAILVERQRLPRMYWDIVLKAA